MAEKSLETTHATSSAAEGLASSGTLRRVDPSHRAPILVRIPNVHQPQQPSSGLLERCKAILLAVVKFLIPAPPPKRPAEPQEPALTSVLEPEAVPAIVVASVTAAVVSEPVVAASSESLASEPSASEPALQLSLNEKIQILARAIETLAWLRARPMMAVPSLVGCVLALCGMLHMLWSSNTPAPSEGPEVFMGSPVGSTGLAPLGSTSVQPATGDGNMSAPTERMAEDAPPFGSPHDHGPILAPALPGVARLKGRIEPLTPTVDSRNEQDRHGIR